MPGVSRVKMPRIIHVDLLCRFLCYESQRPVTQSKAELRTDAPGFLVCGGPQLDRSLFHFIPPIGLHQSLHEEIHSRNLIRPVRSPSCCSWSVHGVFGYLDSEVRVSYWTYGSAFAEVWCQCVRGSATSSNLDDIYMYARHGGSVRFAVHMFADLVKGVKKLKNPSVHCYLRLTRPHVSWTGANWTAVEAAARSSGGAPDAAE